jgi:hypothetical protein
MRVHTYTKIPKSSIFHQLAGWFSPSHAHLPLVYQPAHAFLQSLMTYLSIRLLQDTDLAGRRWALQVLASGAGVASESLLAGD